MVVPLQYLLLPAIATLWNELLGPPCGKGSVDKHCPLPIKYSHAMSPSVFLAPGKEGNVTCLPRMTGLSGRPCAAHLGNCPDISGTQTCMAQLGFNQPYLTNLSDAFLDKKNPKPNIHIYIYMYIKKGI